MNSRRGNSVDRLWRNGRTSGLWLAAILVIGACATARAQSFSGNDMRNIPGRPGEWILKGNVIIVSQGNRIYSDYAEYNQKTTSCVAYGNLRIFTKDGVKITGKRLVYDGPKQTYNVEEDVVLDDGTVVMRTPELAFEGKNNTAAYEDGGVMTSGETVLKSKRGFYEGRTQMFYCYDEVVIVNPEYTIWTDTLHYHRSGLAKFFGPTNIETNDYYMYSRWGWFHQEKEQVSLRDDAYIKTKETQILYGDSIYYDLAQKRGNVHRNVFLEDTAQNCYIKSEYAENDEQAGYAFFTQNPRAVMVQGETDSLFMVGDTMRLTYMTVYDTVWTEGRPVEVHTAGGDKADASSDKPKGKERKKDKGARRTGQKADDEPSESPQTPERPPYRVEEEREIKELLAYPAVRFYKADVQGKCDTLIYFRRDSLMFMLHDPVVWMSGYQVDGDTIRLWLKENRPDRVWVNENVFMAARVVLKAEDTVTKSNALEVEAGEWFNQIKGKEMWGYFDDSSTFRLADVSGHAEAVYYVVDDEKNELIGINKSLSKRIKMYFENASIQGVNLVEPERTALYPEPDLTQRERILKGFHWVTGLRPRSQYDLAPEW